MHDRVRRFVRGLDSDYIDACSTATLNDNMDISQIPAIAQGIEDRRHLQYMTERVDRERHKRDRPAGSYGFIQGGPRPRYSSRPPRPPPQQFQESRFDRHGQSGPSEGSRASGSQQ
uniref:Gag-pol polyprotein n=1 Tax=Solanum tuberosum TaxID=4113 RepID=M1DDM4_SOLTU